MSRVFIDTSYIVALAFYSDTFHQQAHQLAQWVERENVQAVTTRAVLLEIGNALSKRRYRYRGIQIIDKLEQNPFVEIVPLTESLYERAFNLFKQRSDKEWGLVDCISYVAMKDADITQALTGDRHFQQMGFRALLLE